MKLNISSSEHHKHLRKRIHQKLERYPHPNKYKNFLDKIIYVVGISGPIMTIPQLIQIWVHKNAAGVSLVSWGWYLATAVIWLMYAIAHREKPLIITYILWILVEIFIVLGIVLYG